MVHHVDASSVGPSLIRRWRQRLRLWWFILLRLQRVSPQKLAGPIDSCLGMVPGLHPYLLLLPPAGTGLHPEDGSGHVLALGRHLELRLSDLEVGLCAAAVEFLAEVFSQRLGID